MTERPPPAPAGSPSLGRWLLVAALILLGIALFFRYGPSSRPAAPPVTQEGP